MWPKPENEDSNFFRLPSVHIPMPIGKIDDYPVLAACLEAWRPTAANGFPQSIDPLDMPPAAIKAISLRRHRYTTGFRRSEKAIHTKDE